MQKVKLREVRKRKGYTQQQIADVLPTDVSNYSRKEAGTVSITKTEWNKIADFLDVPFEDIYEEEEMNIIVDHPVFNDSPGSAGVIGNNVNNFTNDMSMSLLKHLQDYIDLLKIENERLKSENESAPENKTSQ